tara:strand:- start:1833 stop:2423 length:591 start_codon:yes stop_codon:yes gene_type:complete
MTASRLILASQSSRRRQLLKQLGVKFSVRAQDIDESYKGDEQPFDLATRLAEEKAEICFKKSADPDVVVLASDTIVVLEEDIFVKPKDRNDAIRMLLRLSAKTHRVLTAVSARCHTKSKTILSETFVNFRIISSAEAGYYWDTGEPRDKAGAYAIQGFGAAFIKYIEGSYSGVMGLPLYETAELLGEFGIDCWQKV